MAQGWGEVALRPDGEAEELVVLKRNHKKRALAATLMLGFAALPAHAGIEVTIGQQETSVPVPVPVPAKRPEPAAATLAYEAGMRAYARGDIDKAVKLLKNAAAERVFLAQFYLARIYGTPQTAYYDAAQSYELYYRLARDNADSDPQLDVRGPFVGRAELELARYLKVGIAEIGLAADPVASRDYLVRAAQIFGDADAQYELAHLDLSNPETVRAGLDLMETAAQRRSHAGAQAYMAKLWLSGELVGERRPDLAFAYATLSVENAPDQDRIWIESDFQHVFCATSLSDREAAEDLIEQLRSLAEAPEIQIMAPLPIAPAQRDNIAMGVTWRCQNGTVVASPAQRPATEPNVATDLSIGLKDGMEAVSGNNAAGLLGFEQLGYRPAGMDLDQLQAPNRKVP